MRLPIFEVDAFTSRVFGGNPAAVCPLESWLADRTLQSIAAENNLAETAFLVGGEGAYEIRWMTPTTEVDLCGHATLASAHVLWEQGHIKPCEPARFHSKSGVLSAKKDGTWIEMNFPATPAKLDTEGTNHFVDPMNFQVQNVDIKDPGSGTITTGST